MRIKKIGNIKKIISSIFFISVIINFVWEMAQMPFYNNYHFNLENSLFCFIASLGDAIMILIIFLTGKIVFKNYSWIDNLNIYKILFTLIAGLILAIFVELAGLRLDLWNYSNFMPKIKFLSIGILPVLQMLILPLGVFQLIKLKKNIKGV